MRDPRLRIAGVIVGLPLSVVAGIGVGTLIDHVGAPTLVSVLIALVPVLVYGWAANRWWAAFPLPVVVGGAYLMTLRIVDWKTGGCSVCGEDEDWSNAPYWYAATVLLPVTSLAVVGVGLH